MVASPPSTSALSSLEAMLNSLMGRTEGGDEMVKDALGSPAPPLPARPVPRGRRPSPPWVVGAAAPWTPPPSPHERNRPSIRRRQEDAVAGEEDPVLVEELERKATVAEVRLRQKEEENAALRRRIESYHVKWVEYEIKIKSLEETFDDQMASLQMARDDAARLAVETPEYGRRHESSESHMKMSEEAPARLRRGVGGRRSAEPAPWQPGVPSGNSMVDLKRLKSQFRAWKKDYKARLHRAQVELDRDRRSRSSCWI